MRPTSSLGWRRRTARDRGDLATVRARFAPARTRPQTGESTHHAATAAWPRNILSAEVFDDRERRKLLAPWSDAEIADARTRLLLEALRLHKQFLPATAPIMRRNLTAAFDLISGAAPAGIAGSTAGSGLAVAVLLSVDEWQYIMGRCERPLRRGRRSPVPAGDRCCIAELRIASQICAN